MGDTTREVAAIWWNGANGDNTLTAVGPVTLVYQTQYHGDHQCEEVIEYHDGVEVARHNARYIASIRWAGVPAKEQD